MGRQHPRMDRKKPCGNPNPSAQPRGMAADDGHPKVLTDNATEVAYLNRLLGTSSQVLLNIALDRSTFKAERTCGKTRALRANASSPTDVAAFKRNCRLSMRKFDQHFSVDIPCS
ncbi:hypothetical protein Bbelb_242890 [Branchiostoma belcheri]|nr:hypothetical protein Bbelb_242890 [Branchiostoma belcheri]